MKLSSAAAALAFLLNPLPAFSQEACGAGEPTQANTASCAVDNSAKTFGAPIDDRQQKPQDLKAAIGKIATTKDRDVLVQAQIDNVCQQKGCWAVLRQDDTQARMTFKDYAFFLPKDSKGRKVLALGKLKEKELSVADARHYLQDAGAPKEEIEKIKAPRKEYSFVASGVRFLD